MIKKSIKQYKKQKYLENSTPKITYQKAKYQENPDVQLVYKKCRYQEYSIIKSYQKTRHQENPEILMEHQKAIYQESPEILIDYGKISKKTSFNKEILFAFYTIEACINAVFKHDSSMKNIRFSLQNYVLSSET